MVAESKAMMNPLQEAELTQVTGGAFSFNATFLNALSRSVNTILDFGRTIGTSIRMIFGKRYC